MNLLDAQGKPIPNEEQKKQAEEIQEIMKELAPLLQGKSLDVGVSVAMNTLLTVFNHIHPKEEEAFVGSILTSVGQAFAQASQVKRQIAAQIAEQQGNLNGAIREAVNQTIKH